MTHLSEIYPALDAVRSPTVTTEQAAYYCNRAPQTMRFWASAQPAGVPRPLRLNGRLAWRVADLQKFLNGEAI